MKIEGYKVEDDRLYEMVKAAISEVAAGLNICKGHADIISRIFSFSIRDAHVTAGGRAR